MAVQAAPRSLRQFPRLVPVWIFAFLLTSIAAAAKDWPQWRGLNRDAVSGETQLLREWPSGGPKVVWRTSVGEGFSSISVSNRRLYSQWEEGQDQFLVCLDSFTGEELWRYRIDASFTNNWGNGPRSTPTVDGAIVYAVSAQGKLHAVNTGDGQAAWTHDLAAEYGSRIPVYGYASSPLIFNDKLLVEVGGRRDHAFLAFDKLTGEVVWTSQTDAAAYSSPLAITVSGVSQIIFFSASGLFGLAPEDGRLLWKYQWDSRCPATGIPTNVAQPVLMKPDKIFVSGGYGTVTGSALIRLERADEGFRAETVWKTETMRSQLNSAVFHEGHVYGFDIGTLKAIDARTGEERWKARGFQRGSLILADGHLIVLGEQGRLALVEATPAGYREKASTQALQGRSWTMPALAGGRLFLRNQSEMVSLDLGLARE